MSETASVDIFLPLSGVEKTVDVTAEEEAYTMIDDESGETFNGYQVTYRGPEYLDEGEEPWFELRWTMERVDGDETAIESAGELTMTCPNCGVEKSVGFTQDEFEELRSFCVSCGDDINVIRDQPTESGQSDVINYTVYLF